MTFDDFTAAMEARRIEAVALLAEGNNRRRDGRVLLATEFGLWDPLWLPAKLIKRNGMPDQKRIDDVPYALIHNCDEIPSLEAIPAAIAKVTKASDDKAEALGNLCGFTRDEAIAKSKAWACLNMRIRGLMRAVWLYHLWAGGDCTKLRAKHYHPIDVRPYWALADAMQAKDDTLSNALAYLAALCVEYKARTQKAHAGEAFHVASMALLGLAAA